MKSRKVNFAIAVASVLAAAFLAIVPNFGLLRLSLLTLSVIPVVNSDDTSLTLNGHPYLPFFRQGEVTSGICLSALAQIEHLAATDSTAQNIERLKEFVYLSCDSDENLVRRFQSQAAAGTEPSLLQVLNISAIMERTGLGDEALALRRLEPDSIVWYVERGRIAIEREHNEAQAFQYFELADQISPSYDARKIPMYMYLCLATVRDGKVYVLQNPCADFDRADQSASSALLLGRFYYNQGAYKQALNPLSRAAEMATDLGDAYYWLGLDQVAAGDAVSALRAFQRGAQNAPLFPWNYLELARIQADFGCYTAARDALDKMKLLPGEGVAPAAQALLQELDGKQDDCAMELSLRRSFPAACWIEGSARL